MFLIAFQPAALSYSEPSVVGQVMVGILMLVAGMALRRVKFSAGRRAATKTWAPSLLVFGVVGLVLTVARAEGITFLAMPLLSILWVALAVVNASLQAYVWKRRSYEVLPSQRAVDPRAPYLPGKRRP